MKEMPRGCARDAERAHWGGSSQSDRHHGARVMRGAARAPSNSLSSTVLLPYRTSGMADSDDDVVLDDLRGDAVASSAIGARSNLAVLAVGSWPTGIVEWRLKAANAGISCRIRAEFICPEKIALSE